jgi:hypothetical protein
MDGSNWDPLPNDITGPMWDLVVQMRFLLDVEGVSVEQLAEEGGAPCGPVTLRRTFAGEDLPPPDLLKWISRRCGGDLRELQELYQLAVQAEADARRAAAEVRRAGVPVGQVSAPVRRAARQAEQRAAEEEFWGPIGDARNWSDRMFRRGSAEAGVDRREPPRRREPVRRPRSPRGGGPRGSLPRGAGPEDLEGPAPSRIRPTIVAVVLLASFAIGIILATVAIGGQA